MQGHKDNDQNQPLLDTENQESFFSNTWKKTKTFFEGIKNFLSKNKNKIGFGFGIFVMAGAVTASVFFGPALYTAITGLSAAVFPALAAITTGLAAAVPPIGLAIIAATIVVAFALGLYFTIDSARSIKAQKELSSEVKSDEQPLNPNQPTLAPNQQFVDAIQPILDPNQKKKDEIDNDNL